MPAPSDVSDADRELDLELQALQREREDIISGHAIQTSAELLKCKKAFAGKVQCAVDYFAFRDANLQRHFDLDEKYAWDDYCHGKARLREQIVITHLERKKRIDSVKAGVAKRRKRSRVSMPSSTKAAAAAAAHAAAVAAAAASTTAAAAAPPTRHQLTGSLEAQGLVRINLAPDEINRDLALILSGLDKARTPSGSHAAGAYSSGTPGSVVGASRKTDPIHSSRGILHFHKEVFEKGDSIIAFPPNKPSSPKYAGIIMSLNGKEIMVRSHKTNAEGKQETNRVYVSHLRKNTISIAHAPLVKFEEKAPLPQLSHLLIPTPRPVPQVWTLEPVIVNVVQGDLPSYAHHGNLYCFRACEYVENSFHLTL